MGIFSSIFGGNKSPEQENEKKFDILKYDGIRAMRIGKLTYAIKCFEEATALREDVETLQHQANAYVRANRMEDARALLARITELAPEDASAFLALANLCYMQDDYRAMDEACRRALALDADNPATHFLAAKASLGLSNGIQAIRENGFGRENIPAMMAAVVVISLPLIVLFLIFRNKIMAGVARGGTKG